MNLIKNKKILDLGCGDGWLASILKSKDYIGLSYSKIEVNNLMMERQRRLEKQYNRKRATYGSYYR